MHTSVLSVTHHRVNQVQKDQMAIQAHLDQKVPQVLMEIQVKMVFQAEMDVMVHLEDASINEESLQHPVKKDPQESQ